MELGKKAGIAVLTSDKIDFIVKLIRQDEEGHSTNQRENLRRENYISEHRHSKLKSLSFIKPLMEELMPQINLPWKKCDINSSLSPTDEPDKN